MITPSSFIASQYCMFVSSDFKSRQMSYPHVCQLSVCGTCSSQRSNRMQIPSSVSSTAIRSCQDTTCNKLVSNLNHSETERSWIKHWLEWKSRIHCGKFSERIHCGKLNFSAWSRFYFRTTTILYTNIVEGTWYHFRIWRREHGADPRSSFLLILLIS